MASIQAKDSWAQIQVLNQGLASAGSWTTHYRIQIQPKLSELGSLDPQTKMPLPLGVEEGAICAYSGYGVTVRVVFFPVTVSETATRDVRVVPTTFVVIVN